MVVIHGLQRDWTTSVLAFPSTLAPSPPDGFVVTLLTLNGRILDSLLSVTSHILRPNSRQQLVAEIFDQMLHANSPRGEAAYSLHFLQLKIALGPLSESNGFDSSHRWTRFLTSHKSSLNYCFLLPRL